jgi:hypothetical protein
MGVAVGIAGRETGRFLAVRKGVSKEEHCIRDVLAGLPVPVAVATEE